MSKTAPWLALSIDWNESEMFDDANNGERLAWIFLLCFVKAQGRAGKVRLRDRAFAQKFRLSTESVNAMLTKAVSAGAVTLDGEGVVSVVNWRLYQDPRVRHGVDDNSKPAKQLEQNGHHFTKSAATTNRAPSTDHLNTRGPRTAQNSGSASGRGSGARASKRPRVEEGTLRDFQQLRIWFDDEITRSGTTLNGSDGCWQNVKAAAAKALRDYSAGKCNDPVAIFKWVCGINEEKQTHWDYLDDVDDDAVKKMMREVADKKRVS